MGQIVLTLPLSKIETMQQAYQNQLKTAPQGAIFAAKTTTSSITAYRSGKVLFQGKQPEVEAAKWGNIDTPLPKKQTKAKKAHAFSPSNTLFQQSHIGSDEAGTGDYFGPITVCAAYVKDSQIELLKELGVRDSKNLTDDSIRAITKKLLQLELPYSLVVLHNEKYNQLQAKGWTQGKMKTMLHHHAINKLLTKIAPTKPAGVLIDQFCEPHVYERHLKSENATIQENVYFLTKAESHSIAVAAGSIIARASFVKEMEKLSDKAGFNLPKGASAKVDQSAAYLMKKQGKENLQFFAKVHFANTKKAAKYYKK
ncbi:ribonuclease HIII [Paraliobacillus ryukyuensis]|uniref:Ribonuclease HIII n=1 Tax=Paraliobacillus ryukyuensis TaxID=200904 RepID=A0A366EAQ4_9BACI|nr:ribonuclease HIII [Paraliobacillus ryukyuensis]RBO99446.1 ribonuclease HIII [Paraliobacillus ryukyuensis]